MQISSRFTIALHILCCIYAFGDTNRITSEFLAESVQVNPVVIRNILGQLKAAGIVEVKRGQGGASLIKDPSDLSFLDVYKAVSALKDESLFHFHERPNEHCPVGKNIHDVLDARLQMVQDAMEAKLQEMSLADMFSDLKKDIEA